MNNFSLIKKVSTLTSKISLKQMEQYKQNLYMNDLAMEDDIVMASMSSTESCIM